MREDMMNSRFSQWQCFTVLQMLCKATECQKHSNLLVRGRNTIRHLYN